MAMVGSRPYDISRDPHHLCVLSVPKSHWYATADEINDLRTLGCAVDHSPLSVLQLLTLWVCISVLRNGGATHVVGLS